MHSLGAFVGHIVKAARTDVRPAAARPATESGARPEPGGFARVPESITLRRTVVEEVEIRRAAAEDESRPTRPTEGASP